MGLYTHKIVVLSFILITKTQILVAPLEDRSVLRALGLRRLQNFVYVFHLNLRVLALKPKM